MSDPCLLPEILDHVADLLQNNRETLEQCCLVSKSWVPRTRKHLFAHVELRLDDQVELWRETFPDPADSPAYHTRSLKIIGCTLGNAEENGWITGLCRVERLEFELQDLQPFPLSNWGLGGPSAVNIPFATFRDTVSRSLKSLSLQWIIPHPHAFNFINSCPLLESLNLSGIEELVDEESSAGQQNIISPSASPPLTGTLELRLLEKIVETPRLLLALPGGLHFRKLKLICYRDERFTSVIELIAACSHTLECLDLTCRLDYDSSGRINLSSARQLKEAVFRCESLTVGWITTSLGSITPAHRDLQKISLHIPLGSCSEFNKRMIEGADLGMRWSDLDHLLVQFWESHSIRPKVSCPEPPRESRTTVQDWVKFLLPELMKRGIIDIVEIPRMIMPF